jgi:xanthine/uracil permease
MRKWKTGTLIILAALSFASPALERAVTGRVEMLSNFGWAEMLLSLIVFFCWYHLDKAEYDYRAGRLMNAGMLVLAALALPIYLIRSRGWKRGGRAIGVALAFLAGTLLLAELGEWLGAALTS